MKYFLLSLLGMVLFSIFAFSQASKDFFIVSYNVENLFDTIDDPVTFDEDFTPEGKKNWTPERYEDKLKKMAQVLVSITPELPEIIGLVEIENEKVLKDFISLPECIKANYAMVHEESPDKRGIDVALLYKPGEFQYLLHQKIEIYFPFDNAYTTRNILFVKGIVNQKDTLYLYVNHWPSRRGGKEQSEPKRIHVAKQLRKHVDSIQNVVPDAHIIIMGDFNDNPVDKSLFEEVKANNIKSNPDNSSFYNLFYDIFNKDHFGSYVYRGNYNMLDNILVSQSLLNTNNRIYTTYDSGEVFAEEWLCNPNSDQKAPFRTYGGPNYLGGYSDHFPVYFVLKIRGKD